MTRAGEAQAAGYAEDRPRRSDSRPVFGIGLMLGPFRNHEHLSRTEVHDAVPKIDPQVAINDDECLVSILMRMPNEISLQPHNLELVIV
jgi:hypothetical protein